MFKKNTAVTLVEAIVSVAIFSLIILGIYSAVDIGFKVWQLGEVKTDFYSRARVILSYITKDFKYSNWISTKIENDGDHDSLNEYIAFESPVKDTGDIDIEVKSGKPLWQKYVYYYIYPSVKNQPNAEKRTLYRRMEERNPKNSTPMPLTAIAANYLTASTIANTNLRTIGKEIYEINFEQIGTGLIITLKFRANVYEQSSVAFENRKVTEVIELKASVIPEN